MFVGLKSFGYLMLSKTLLRAWKRSELSASCDLRLCVDDVPCVHYGIGYFFLVVAVVVIATWLRPRSLVCWWLTTPRAMDACDFLILLISLILVLQLLLTMMASWSTACLRYDCCGGPRPGAMKREQRVLSLELLNSVFGKVYDTFHLWVLRHLHESQGCFCHRGDWGPKDWIRGVVEFVVEVAREKASTLGSLSPAFSFTLISCPASCASSCVLVLWSVLDQVVF